MRVIIAGSRGITAASHLDEAMKQCGFEPSIIISGHAKGPDQLGEQWAYAHGISMDPFPADWELYGKRAGVIRNKEMAERADALVAIWDGNSRGTLNMIHTAARFNLKIFVYFVPRRRGCPLTGDVRLLCGSQCHCNINLGVSNE